MEATRSAALVPVKGILKGPVKAPVKADPRRLLRLALPIMVAFVSINIVGLVDTLMVAALGIEALAAVGLAQIVAASSSAVLVGVGAGVQAIVARRKGENSLQGVLVGLSAGIVLGLGVAVFIMLCVYPWVPAMLAALNGDGAVVALATPYLQWRLATCIVMAFSVAFGAFWNAIGKSSHYMLSVIAMNIFNVLFNYMFIFGHWGAPQLGVTGAAVATALATVLSAAINLLLYFHLTRQLPVRWVRPPAAALALTARLSLPAGFGGLQSAAAMSVVIWVVGLIGTREVGIVNVLFTVVATVVLPAMALGTAAGTLVGQSLGQRQPQLARQWGWYAIAFGTAITALLALPVFLYPRQLLALFVDEPLLLQLAVGPVRITAVAVLLMNASAILTQALYGAGESARVLTVTMAVQWLLIVPAILCCGLVFDSGLAVIWGLFTLGMSLLTTILLLGIWHRGHWVETAYRRLRV